MTAEVRLAVIRQRYTPFGGAERFLENALAALAARGVELTLLTRRWPRDAQHLFTPVVVNPPYIGRLWRDLSFAHAVRAAVATSDATLIQSHERIDCCDLYRAGDGLHSVWLDERLAGATAMERLRVRASPYHRYTLDAERRLFASKRLKSVICISRMVQNDIRERFGIAVERLPIIYNAVDGEAFSPRLSAGRAAARAALRIDDERVVFLLVGSGYERKGVGRAIEALAGVPAPAHLVVVGHDRNPARYFALASRHGVGARVTFAGPHADPRPFYGAADVFLLPTLYDPLSNAVLEALACGLPVITSTRCGAGELVAAHGAGIVCGARDIAAIGDAMRALLMQSVRERAAARARRAVSSLTPDAMAARLVDLYQAMLGGDGAATP
ncbi:MAG: glycosyltransferase family 4 protein [Burkholderiales bacterium]